jgi:hypothetical protein
MSRDTHSFWPARIGMFSPVMVLGDNRIGTVRQIGKGGAAADPVYRIELADTSTAWHSASAIELLSEADLEAMLPAPAPLH